VNRLESSETAMRSCVVVLGALSFDTCHSIESAGDIHPAGGVVALQIVALILIAVLLLFPAARMFGFLRSDRRSQNPVLPQGFGQLIDQFLIPILVLAFLTIAVLMHFGPF
jgi:hypothetical protein